MVVKLIEEVLLSVNLITSNNSTSSKRRSGIFNCTSFFVVVLVIVIAVIWFDLNEIYYQNVPLTLITLLNLFHSIQVLDKCFEHKLMVELAGRGDSVLKIMPSLVIEDELLMKGLEIIKQSIKEVTGQ